MSKVAERMAAVPLSPGDLRTVAHLLVRCCSDTTLAALLNDLLGVEADPALTDAEAAAGVDLFGELVEACPSQTLALARGGA
jgi:hypothetical protein